MTTVERNVTFLCTLRQDHWNWQLTFLAESHRCVKLEGKSGIMAGRSLKGQLAFVSTGLLSILNLLATIGGIAGIVIICALEHAPSSIGWLLIVVGGFTVASGLIGIFTSNRRGCFTWQAVLLMFALVGLISASLVIFFKPTLVLQRMNLKISETSAQKIMKFQAAIFFIVFCIDVSDLSLFHQWWQHIDTLYCIHLFLLISHNSKHVQTLLP